MYLKLPLSTVLILISSALSAQGPKQKEIETAFKKEFCSCLEEYLSINPDKIVYDQTEICIRRFFLPDKEELMNQVLKEDTSIDTTLSDYQKGRAIGRKIIFNTIEDLVRDCKYYRQALNEYKQLLIKQVRADSTGMNAAIAEFRTKEPLMSDDPKRHAMYYSIMAVLHEYIGNTKEAMIFYDKSLSTYPTTQAKGLRMVLQLK